MKYTNTYDLMSAIVKLDPKVSIASIDWEYPKGMDLSISTAAFTKDTEHGKQIKFALWDCLTQHFISFCPFGTVEFEFDGFNLTNEELTTKACWFIHHPSTMEYEWEVLGGQEDVWGADITIEKVPDFESIRDELNAAGVVQFDLQMNQTGWIKNELDLQFLVDEIEIEPDKLALIEANLPALQDALQARLKILAEAIVGQITYGGVDGFTFSWSASAYLNNDSGEGVEAAPFKAVVDEFLGVEECKEYFSHPCECTLDVPA
jgi:hypothetical protein